MIISQEYFDKCHPSYQKRLEKLEQRIVDIQNLDITDAEEKAQVVAERVKEVILKFSTKYMTPKEYWNYCIRFVLLFIINLLTNVQIFKTY